ncbi:hypothetical protein H6P81_006508 [Aristolochia fimbriata]|uniref:E1 ubiquitin-activating enzyme n=1 Tax=Aristolochia fimbriata TaxID=158543 RepID=A0AAV7EYP0_ARIFI|nr:hypothetical protein H6P81_006508 [Aristolochia fimbriata]
MHRIGFQPFATDFSYVLSVCAKADAFSFGEQIHSLIVKVALDCNVYIASALINLYGKAGRVFEAQQIFDEMPEINIFACNSLIASYSHSQCVAPAFDVFSEVIVLGILPNQYTFSNILIACLRMGLRETGIQIHCLLVKLGFHSNVVLWTTMIHMYASLCKLEDSRKIFNEMNERNIITWTSMVSALVLNDKPEEVMMLVRKMRQLGIGLNSVTYNTVLSSLYSLKYLNYGKQVHCQVIREGFESNMYVVLTLMTMYSKCGSTQDFLKVFATVTPTDQISYNSIIAGFSQLGNDREVLNQFTKMRRACIAMDEITYSITLKAIGTLSAMEEGKQTHAVVFKSGYASNIFIQNALISMYSRCGLINHAKLVFFSMRMPDLVSWNSFLSGCAQHGFGREAVEVFEHMRSMRIKPDHTTFLSVLTACSHDGLLQKGLEYFDLMNDLNVIPEAEHYACKVDLLGRAGHLQEAELFIKHIPIEPGASVYRTLLSACIVHGDVHMARRTAQCLFTMYPCDPSAYVLLSNAFARWGLWDDKAQLRELMIERGIIKIHPGLSQIEVKNKDSLCCAIEDQLCCEALSCHRLYHYMLPRKRVDGEAEIVVEGTETLKKPRVDSLISPSVTENNSHSSDLVGPLLLAAMDGNPSDIDEDLHSRQLAVYGRETMRRLFASNVLISGMQGLGAEIAKNLVLAGVKSVTLHDEGNVEMWDLSSNFIFSEDDIGKNRALACVQKLQELNNAVMISTMTTKLSKEQLSSFQAAVFTDITLEKAIEFDDYCHSHQPPIAFIKTEVRGLFGNVFCDFGPEFTVVDVDGEEPHTGIIASITNDNPALVSCVDDERLEFQDGDLVVFSEVHGMTELNDGKPRKIKNARAYSFTLEEDTTNFGLYEKGGIVTQVKQPKVLKFKSLKEALKDPGDFLLSDFSKFDRPPVLHLAFQALDKFICELGRFPVAGSEEDARKLIQCAITINDGSGDAKIEQIDEKLFRNFAFGARAVLNPMAAMFGGIVGQEVVKACSGKFHPLYQFFYFDSLESLPCEPLDPNELKPVNSRYDAQISVFGLKLQKKLEEAKVFIVGSGALGCEFLKNLALMGVCCGNQGKLTITDDDVIEKSNLSRQFLFRDWNIGQAKSTVAASAANAINPRLRVEALQNRASPETENVFNDEFWENLDVVINALDNVNARLYIDLRCIYFQKALLESGTLGAKCNTQMVIPHLTENYGASRDPPEKQAPMCTVHSFPHNIDHCLTWARSEFEGLLEKTPAEVNTFLSDPAKYISDKKNAGDAQARDLLERIIECLDKEKCETFQDCITWARLKFEDYFANRVKQLTFTFPEDAATSTGAPFWSAPKRFPRPLQFSSSDLGHLHFIMAASILRAETFGIPIPEWAKNPQKLANAVDKVLVPDFQPKTGVKIVTDEKATSLSAASVDDAAAIDSLVKKLEDCAKSLAPGFRMKPIQFEKDDDTNFHMDLIAGLANMRARNYSIPEVDKLRAKFIAGRIIPAIATSTAMATGLICLELFKVLSGGHKLEDYRNTFANLALPLFSMAEPVPPKVIKHQDMSWTVWDRWVIKQNVTLRELLQWLKDKGLNAYSISCGTCLLYNSMFPKHKERMDRKVADLAREIARVEIPSYRRHLDVVVACEDEDDNDIDIPLISIYFK